MPLKCLPLRYKPSGLLGALVVRVIHELNHRLSGMQNMRVGNVVKEQEQIVGAILQFFVEPLYGRRILTHKTSARRDRAIHADTLVIRTVPLTPPVSLGGLRSRPIMATQNVRQGAHTQWPGVVLVGGPRGHLQSPD